MIYKALLLLFFSSIAQICISQDSLLLNTIKIIGNHKTKEWVIKRELTHKKGEKIAFSDTSMILDLNQKQLLNTALFNAVEVSFSNDSLLIAVKEKWYFWPIPIIDLADRNFNQWWLSKDPRRLIYGTELKLENVSGVNDKILGNFTLGYTRQADLVYIHPATKNNQNLGYELGVAWLANKEIWYKTMENKVQFYNNVAEIGIRQYQAFAGIIKRKGISQYQYAKINWQRFETSDTMLALNPNFLGDSQTKLDVFSLSYNYIFDKRDVRGQPLKGNYFNILATTSLLKDRIGYGFLPKLEYRSSHFLPLGKKWFSSIGFHGKLSFPEQQPYLINRAIGYDYNVIRGYEYYVIDGATSGVFKTNIKYALLLNKKYNFDFMPAANYKEANNTLFFLVFYDGGFAQNVNLNIPSNNFENRYLQGYGFGLEWVVWFDRMVRLEWARNHFNENGVYLSLKMGV